MGENPSPLGEDFSFVIFVVCKSTEKPPILFRISNTTWFGLQNTGKKYLLGSWQNGCGN